MKPLAAVASPRCMLAGISLLSSIALFSSLYLQYIALYQPCVYCYVLRYLTTGILVMSLAGYVLPRLIREVAPLISGASVVGVGVSTFLIFDELFPTAGFCTACAFAPLIFGVSLYYFSLVFMATVLGLSLPIAFKK